MTENLTLSDREKLMIATSIAMTIVTMEQMPEGRRPEPELVDLRRLMTYFAEGIQATVLLAQAKCRLNPGLKQKDVYLSYGIDLSNAKPIWVVPDALRGIGGKGRPPARKPKRK